MANGFVNDTIYSLKREFGCSLELYIVKAVTPDLATGRTTSDIRKVKVRRAPILQTKDAESFRFGLSFIAANKNFTYGATFGTSLRVFLIDTIDLPVDYVWAEDHYIIAEGRRYNMKGMDRYDGGFIFVAEEMKGQKLEKIYDFKDKILFTEEVTYESVVAGASIWLNPNEQPWLNSDEQPWQVGS